MQYERTAVPIHDLGYRYHVLGRFEEAEPLYRRAHDILRRLLGPNDTHTVAAVRALVELYEHWHEQHPNAGHDVEAAQWRARLDED